MGQFKTDLTLAELAILITNSGLNKGLQYYVTDKDWLLLATKVNKLKPVSGSLHIFHGETLPTGIEPEVLFIDTGIVTGDLTNETGTPIDLMLPTYYEPVGFFPSETFAEFALGINYQGFGLPFQVVSYTNDNVERRATILCIRTELFPIPVPHIVSAETIDSTHISVYLDSFNVLSQVTSSDFIIKINNISCITDEVITHDINEFHIAITEDIPITFGDVITISIASGNIKNTWGGLLAEVTDYPVVNNVPES